MRGAAPRWTLTLAEPHRWLALARFLQAEGQIDMLVLLTATHVPGSYKLGYTLRSLPLFCELTVYFTVPEGFAIPSVASVWPAALWQEREAYDLVGVSFAGHPDLRRLFLPQDWVGHPLRKDYQPPDSYHDITLAFIPPASEGPSHAAL